ncbi:glycosyltransferase family 1 protein [Vibrio kanaloae]|uniref:glycosyltransferase family 1 protein n=2 Tax=Vibrio kanaloae TaxID=170673 RepID=UPI0010BF229C|nr:glycosyltransferase family 1 protein [Vibrio kanaloae]TKF19157.1 glycosyltransferase family 1 protein [Vibrio kanaloae]
MRLVYLSPVPWHSVAQRPHFFAKAALQSGVGSVLWIEPTPSRLPQLNDFRTKLFSVEADSFNIPEGITLFKPRVVPLEPLGQLYDRVNRNSINGVLRVIQEYDANEKDTILVIGKPSRFALKVMSEIKFQKIIFDVMDDFPQFFKGISRRSMERTHRQVIESSDVCFFSSQNLKKKYGGLAKKAQLVLNACDEEFKNDCKFLLKKRTSIVSEHRTFCYVGSIADWFDWESVMLLAKNNPKDKVVIVGPNYSRSTPELPPNVELRKAIQHSEVPELLTSFDYGLIPFKVNELTNSVDPVKYYEYVAAGLNIITTEFGEMRFRVESGSAITFRQFQDGITHQLDRSITWRERFSSIFEDLIGVKKY